MEGESVEQTVDRLVKENADILERLEALERSHDTYQRWSLAIFKADSPYHPDYGTADSGDCHNVTQDSGLPHTPSTTVTETREEENPVSEVKVRDASRATPPTPPSVPRQAVSTQAGGPRATKQGRGQYLDEDWAPTKSDLAWLAREFPHLDERAQTEHFKDHWLASDMPSARKRNWSAAWKNWMRIAAGKPPRGRPEFAPRVGPSDPVPPEPKRDVVARRIQALKANKPEGYK